MGFEPPGAGGGQENEWSVLKQTDKWPLNYGVVISLHWREREMVVVEKVSEYFSTQVLTQGPVMLTCCAGAIVSLMFWRRFPRPCLLTFIAMILQLMTRIVGLNFQAVFWQQVQNHSTLEQLKWYSQVNTLIGLLGGLVSAVGLGLLLGAVFAGRSAENPPAGNAVW